MEGEKAQLRHPMMPLTGLQPVHNPLRRKQGRTDATYLRLTDGSVHLTIEQGKIM